MLLDFNELKNCLLKPRSVDIDNWVFKLHYRMTALLLLVFSLLVSSRQYIGEPIKCMTRSDIPAEVLDQYCWIASTFSLPDAFHKIVGKEVPYPGVDKDQSSKEKVYHQYYQWVCFVLFLQAIMFYVPHYIWKVWEGGRVQSLVVELNCPSVAAEKVDEIVAMFSASVGNRNMYFAKFFFCLLLNMTNVVGQIYFTDKFLGCQFSTYGTEVVRFSELNQEDRIDPMIRIFPRVAKCVFHSFGPSADVQKHDALCILPINIVNEKIYIFLWFWFIIVSVVTSLNLVWHFVYFVFPYTRRICIGLQFGSQLTSTNNDQKFDFELGKCFIIYQVSKNMNWSTFVKFLLVFRNYKTKSKNKLQNIESSTV